MSDDSETVSIDALCIPAPERHLIERWRHGDVSCINVTIAVWEDSREAIAALGRWHRFVNANADIVTLAASGDEIRAAARDGKTAIVFGFQNTSPCEHDIDLFGTFRRLGVCIMQLTYNLQNFIGSGYWEEHDSGVSSRFGRKAIEEMNRQGIVIDLSHCGDRTTLEAIDLSARPVSITHSNPRDYVGAPTFGAGRLRTIDAMKRMASRGGVVGLSPNPHMTRERASGTRADFCDMVAWVVDRVGIDHVGIGTDYCPGQPSSIRDFWRYGRWSREVVTTPIAAPGEGWPEWFTSTASFQAIRDGLLDRGFSPTEASKVMGGNFLRLFSEGFEPQP
jgi:microsomal dipeptidase-like Zn-dependent dipeptidase